MWKELLLNEFIMPDEDPGGNSEVSPVDDSSLNIVLS